MSIVLWHPCLWILLKAMWSGELSDITRQLSVSIAMLEEEIVSVINLL